MAHNVSRQERMKSLYTAELRRIVEGKTLRSASARHELARREAEKGSPSR